MLQKDNINMRIWDCNICGLKEEKIITKKKSEEKIGLSGAYVFTVPGPFDESSPNKL